MNLQKLAGIGLAEISLEELAESGKDWLSRIGRNQQIGRISGLTKLQKLPDIGLAELAAIERSWQ